MFNTRIKRSNKKHTLNVVSEYKSIKYEFYVTKIKCQNILKENILEYFQTQTHKISKSYEWKCWKTNSLMFIMISITITFANNKWKYWKTNWNCSGKSINQVACVKMLAISYEKLGRSRERERAEYGEREKNMKIGATFGVENYFVVKCRLKVDCLYFVHASSLCYYCCCCCCCCYYCCRLTNQIEKDKMFIVKIHTYTHNASVWTR